MVKRNLVNLIQINILVMAVENRVISRLNVPTMMSKKMETSRRRKKGKAKKACVAWDDNDVSSSSSSDDEEANLCLQASVTSNMIFTSSSKGNTYYQLLDAFNETHDEANRLALFLNRLKGLNN